MSISVTERDNLVSIAIKDRFDFHVHKAFRAAYVEKTDPQLNFEINLREASYLDSSAIGMLLLLRENLRPDQRIIIQHCSPDVKRLLEMAHMEGLGFTIA